MLISFATVAKLVKANSNLTIKYDEDKVVTGCRRQKEGCYYD